MTTRHFKPCCRNEENAMPFIPVPNTIQLELVYNWAGQVCQTVLHYTKAAPWTLVTMEEAAASMVLEWDVAMQPHIASTLSLIQLRLTDLESVTSPVLDYADGLPLAGTHAVASLPNNVACVITKRTALRGRSYRGRIYHPGLTESQVTGNTVETGAVVTLLGIYTSMLSLALTADEALMTVVSRIQEGVPLTTGIATLVTGLTCDGTVDSQRRRLPGRGS